MCVCVCEGVRMRMWGEGACVRVEDMCVCEGVGEGACECM